LQLDKFPLAKIGVVDALNAALSLPGLFPPVAHSIGPDDVGILFDAATTTSNPTLALFSYATSREHGLSWAATPNDLSILSVGSGIVERDVANFARMPAMIQAVMALSGAVASSTLETVQRSQETFETRKPFFVRGFGAHVGMPAQRKLGRYQRVDAMLEPNFVRPAYGVEIDARDYRLIRDNYNAAPRKMSLLREIGMRAAAQIFNEDDAL